MTISLRFGLGSAVAVAVLSAAAWNRPDAVPFGFTRASASRQTPFERRFLALPSAGSMREAHQFLADQPHIAGSARDRVLAEWTRERFELAGLEDVAITTHDVLLPWPEEVRVEMIAPRQWRASMREDPVPGDRHTQPGHADPGIAYHAYSASGDITAPVVFAGAGQPADYDWLSSQGIDVRGRIVLVRHSMPYSYRGFKAYTAQQRGAAGLLIYSDPADDGAGRGPVYPAGPWGPESHLQRGGIAYDFLVPGDPLTPGWASTPGARRVDARGAPSLPTIVSAPLSYTDARVILESLGGPEVPAGWRGTGTFEQRAGPGHTVIRLRVRTDDRIRPIWTVTGLIRGSEQPDDVVIVGNHRDAWIYGGVDPSSGSAALVELARVFGEMVRVGWRPRRTILFTSWDAEEFALISSTEWGEQHQEWLRKRAVAYLNVDSAAAGSNLSLSAVPALNQMLDEVARTVRDPASGLTLAAATRDRQARKGGRPTGTIDDIVENRLGGGSDYTVFLNFLGVPVADLSFDGPYGVYHSLYDTHAWVATIGDPGFRYHVALVQFWGLVTLRLAGADVLPLDYEPYARRVEEFASDVARRWAGGPDEGREAFLKEVNAAAAELRTSARLFNQRRDAALAKPERMAFERLDRQLMGVERALVDPEGIPGRPWYRHLVYAPRFTYAPEVLPGVAEAVDAGDSARARRQSTRLAAALRRAASTLAFNVVQD
jgi:N-acetylated-alpha-linked acidic dipeptidase